MTGSLVIDRLRTERSALLAAGAQPGRLWSRALSAATDRAVRELAIEAGVADFGLAVVAVGGSGREELAPGSDVDLLLLHSGLDQDRLKGVVQAVVYPLWDAGLTVGYAVRTPKECRSQGRDDLDATTALLDGRTLHGDGGVLRQARDLVVRDLRNRPQRFLEELADADRTRRRRAGDAAEGLEPNVKDGAGGLRDVQSLRWAAAALIGRAGLDPLVSAGYLGAADRQRLADAYNQLLATRIALHLEQGIGRKGAPNAGKDADVLRMERQQAVALRRGYRDGDDDLDTAAHRLLTDHYLAARVIDHAHRRAWTLLMADARRGRRLLRRQATDEVGGFPIVDGVLQLPDDLDVGALLRDADGPMRLFSALARTGAVIDRTAAAAIRRVVESETAPIPWTVTARRRFLAALAGGNRVLRALAELDDVGLLSALLPEWEELRGRPQRNPFHLYSLDRHAWHAVAQLGRVVRETEWGAATLERVDDRDALVLGTLVHDVGKVRGEPHSLTGIPIARAVAERIGLPAATVDRIGTLVELHLLLPDVATKRDLADSATIEGVAAAVKDRGTLSSLHLLAAADGAATGTSAWTSWKASLITSLVTKVHAVLNSHDVDDLADGAAATAQEAQRIAPDLGIDAGIVRDHLSMLPQRYAASVSARAVVRHAGMASRPLVAGEVHTRVTPGEERRMDDVTAPQPGQEFDELDVIAIDSPGLFAKVAGVLALHGGSVVQAHAFTRNDDVAVDTFVVSRPADVRGSWWAAVEGDIDEAVSGRLALRARVARQARTEEKRLARLPDVASTVTAVEDPGGRATILEVHTLDRLGVLFTIVMALAELELDIVLAKILTMGHEVVDSFYVRTPEGDPLDEDHVREVRLAVVTALEAQ